MHPPSGQKPSYPGEEATATEIRLLAEQYFKAAELLKSLNQTKNPAALAPFRLAAIHAIELFLNAHLVSTGHTAVEIRELKHDLTKRLELAQAKGLILRAKTARHIETIVDTREYLVTRYSSKHLSKAPPQSRLEATLKEIRRKVVRSMDGAEVNPASSRPSDRTAAS
ncbi:MAG: hypothetical protein ACKVP5_19935 [Aestuariivirga sp.]